MHHVTSHGAPKITMDSKERDYQGKLRQATAQADGNPNVMGVQAAQAQLSSANNTPIEIEQNLAGSVNLGTSMTNNVNKNPEQFQTEELNRRLSMYTNAAGNAGYSLNDRSVTGAL